MTLRASSAAAPMLGHARVFGSAWRSGRRQDHALPLSADQSPSDVERRPVSMAPPGARDEQHPRRSGSAACAGLLAVTLALPAWASIEQWDRNRRRNPPSRSEQPATHPRGAHSHFSVTTHLHASSSFNAMGLGAGFEYKDAYRFAHRRSHVLDGAARQAGRPLDFLVAADHSS